MWQGTQPNGQNEAWISDGGNYFMLTVRFFHGGAWLTDMGAFSSVTLAKRRASTQYGKFTWTKKNEG